MFWGAAHLFNGGRRRRRQDLKATPTVDFLMGRSDDNMDLSDSESDEPRLYKSDAYEKSIANLKVPPPHLSQLT